MNFEDQNKILIIRLSSLGDVLLTTPLLRALKQKYPGSKIHFLVKSQYADAVRFNPNIYKIHIYEPNKITELIHDVKSFNYNFIIDLQNSFRSRSVTRNLGKRILRYSKPSLKKFLLVNFKINLLKDLKPISKRYAEAIDGFELDSNGLELFIPGDITSQLSGNENFIGFCPGSQHFTKRWLPEYFIELGNLLVGNGYKIAILGGSDDKNICTEISNRITGSINLQNDNNLFQIAADMKKCKLVVSNDSGLMHTAAAVGVPVVSFFGSSVKEFGFSPYGINNLILENNSLNCRPCSHIGRAECPKGHFKCMKDLTPPFVFNQLQNFMNRI